MVFSSHFNLILKAAFPVERDLIRSIPVSAGQFTIHILQDRVSDQDPGDFGAGFLKRRSDPDPFFKIWSEPDPVYNIWWVPDLAILRGSERIRFFSKIGNGSVFFVTV